MSSDQKTYQVVHNLLLQGIVINRRKMTVNIIPMQETQVNLNERQLFYLI
jgi:hypothetical protein